MTQVGKARRLNCALYPCENKMTPNRENIIKALYSLGLHKEYISNKEIAHSLGISPPSVSEMLLKLKNEGYIEHFPYKGCRLTEKGLECAIQVVRYHRLWEVFLIEHLGYSWGEAHYEAELLEHATTEKLALKLDQFLAHPKYCPYDMIMPEAGGKSIMDELIPLHLCEECQRFTIINFWDDPELLDYLQKLDVQVGMAFTLKSKSAYGGDITLKGEHGEIELSIKACSRIFVQSEKVAPPKA